MSARRVLTTLGLILALAATLTPPVLAAPARPNEGRAQYYVSLGDSLSVGIQPDATGANQPSDVGYADQVYGALLPAMPRLQLVKLGCSGETTQTMIEGGICAYEKGSQLDEAVAFLRTHRPFVKLVAIDIGADDLLPCAGETTVDLACVQSAFDQVPGRLFQILRALRQAAGPDVPIVAINYYNPLVAAWLQGGAGQELALQSASLLGEFNAMLRAIYGLFSVPVGDVAAAFDSADFSTIVVVPGLGPVPQNVALVCGLTWMCVFPPQGPNVHPTADGYGVISEVILGVLPQSDGKRR